MIVEGLESIVRIRDPNDEEYDRYVYNSIKSTISTFLCTPTDHDMRLEFVDCEVVGKCNEIYSKEYPLVKKARDTCVCGQLKSLSISMGSPLFPPQWLFEYPKLRFKKLELSYKKLTFDLYTSL